MRAALVLVLSLLGGPAGADGLVAAHYADPTDRYDHRILGATPDWGTLVMRTAAGRHLRIVLPGNRVFEDTAPRLADIDGDGATEAIVVETDLSKGARLAVYGANGLVAATAFIGRTHRWLAPVGAADLDGDGRVEIAYIDRPHLARILRVVRFEDGGLREVARLDGLTNHRIGDPDITGGIRRCPGQAPALVLYEGGWNTVNMVELRDGGLHARPTSNSVEKALACPP